MAGQLENRVALITGAGSGIGRASALAMASEGAKLVVADINEAGGQETVRQIKEKGGEATSIAVDVTNAADVQAMVKAAVEIYGRLDCAYNNAGVGGGGRLPAADLSEEVWDRVMAINLNGIWLCMKYEIPVMLQQGAGVIVNASSALGLVGRTGSPA